MCGGLAAGDKVRVWPRMSLSILLLCYAVRLIYEGVKMYVHG